MPNEIDDLINRLVPIVKPLVTCLEAKPAMTKDHYGDYMTVIARLADMTGDIKPNSNTRKSVCIGIGVALQRAGANKNGVQAALRVMGYLS